MENLSDFQENNSSIQVDMTLSSEARGFLKEIAKWTKFLSIVGFIGVGLMVIAAFFMGGVMSFLGGMPGMDFPFPSFFITAIYLILAAIYVMPIYYLYQFSSKTIMALELNDTNTLTESFGYLKSHYKFLGIFVIVILSLYALIIVGAIIGGIVAAATAF